MKLIAYQKCKNKITPLFWLSDLFGNSHLFNPRNSYASYGWLPKDSALCNAMTGLHLSITGSIPILCHSGVVNVQGLSLLEEAGLILSHRWYTYETGEQYHKILNRQSNLCRKIVFQYCHPKQEIDDHHYLVNPKLLAFLNNKKNLEYFVPHDHVLPRRLIGPKIYDDSFFELYGGPFAMKAAVDQPSGGGYGVRICSNKTEWRQALSYFGTCKNIIVEKYVPLRKNFCVQFSAETNGKITYLGTTEQIIAREGSYLGNWLGEDVTPSPKIIKIGEKIMRKAQRLGYWGIAGFDIAITLNDKIIVFDLNFRLNGSTVALLLSKSIQSVRGVSQLCYKWWKMENGSYDELVQVTKEAVKKKFLIPLSTFDPNMTSAKEGLPRLYGLLIGKSRKEIVQYDRWLKNRNLI